MPQTGPGRRMCVPRKLGFRRDLANRARGPTLVQSLSWYRNRLLSMQPGEIAWRVSNLVRDKVDRALLGRRQKTLAVSATAQGQSSAPSHSRLPLISLPDNAPKSEDAWRAALIAEADEIVRHHIRLIGRRRVDVGTPIRWNHEHNKDAPTPTTYAGDIDYRDYDETGDCKWVWELNRHHHLVVLGRAYRLTENDAYAREVVAQMLVWIDACEFGTGMNWRSPLELSIRLINWAYALELILPAGVLNDGDRRRIETSIYQHCWDVSRKYSRYSSANNHLIGEAAGVYVAACRFPHLPNAAAWRDEARRILIEEIQNQVDDDGVHRELATGYHLFVLQFFLVSFVVGERSGDSFPQEYQKRLASMCEFLAALTNAGRMPQFCDCDDGYVLDLGGQRGDPIPWLRAAECLGEEFSLASAGADMHPASREADAETAFWLLGVSGSIESRTKATGNRQRGALESRCFADAGIYLLQSGSMANGDAVSATVDVGPLGFKSIAAHGHADALSVTLRAFGVEFLIDPGTYDYFTYPEWRDYFRSTRAHNTLEIDGLDQSEMLGKFLWGRRAEARCIAWRPGDEGATLVAEHDGYTRLDDPVTHRRTVELDALQRVLQIEDELQSAAPHQAALHFHIAPECRVEQIDDSRIRATRDEGAIELLLPAMSVITMVYGATAPILGWCSRAYHERQPITTVRAGFRVEGKLCVKTTVQICANAIRTHE